MRSGVAGRRFSRNAVRQRCQLLRRRRDEAARVDTDGRPRTLVLFGPEASLRAVKGAKSAAKRAGTLGSALPTAQRIAHVLRRLHDLVWPPRGRESPCHVRGAWQAPRAGEFDSSFAAAPASLSRRAAGHGTRTIRRGPGGRFDGGRRRKPGQRGSGRRCGRAGLRGVVSGERPARLGTADPDRATHPGPGAWASLATGPSGTGRALLSRRLVFAERRLGLVAFTGLPQLPGGMVCWHEVRVPSPRRPR
jgi:hypothetical protein